MAHHLAIQKEGPEQAVTGDEFRFEATGMEGSGWTYTWKVHDPSGKLTGVVRLNDLIRIGGAARGGTRLNAVARPLAEVPVTRPDEDLSSLVERAGAALANRALVFENGQLVGIVSPVDIARLLTARQALGRS